MRLSQKQPKRRIENDLQIKNLKPNPEKPYRVTIGANLYLLINPNGAKLWRWDYTLGKRAVFAIGEYPDVSLAQARTVRDKARELVAQGLHPKDHRDKLGLLPARGVRFPFGASADGYLETVDGKAAKTKTWRREDLMVRRLKDGIEVAGFGYVENEALTLNHLLPLLEAVNAPTRRRLLATARNVIAYAKSKGQFPADKPSPFAEINLRVGFQRHHPTKRPALTEPASVAELIRSIDAFEGEVRKGMTISRRRLVRCAMQLQMLTFVRSATVERAQWSDFRLSDSGPSFWIIPFARLKMATQRREAGHDEDDHVIPLSRQAVALLRELQQITGNRTGVGFLFPGAKRPPAANRRASSGAISEGSINEGLHLLGYKGIHCGHGSRSTASTLINAERINGGQRRFEKELVEIQQDRLDASTRAIYDRDPRLIERIELMQFWADKLDQIRAGAVIVPWPLAA